MRPRESNHDTPVLLIENVPEVATGENGEWIATILARLDKLGYCARYAVKDCYDFYLPQHRDRFYLLAWKYGRLGISKNECQLRLDRVRQQVDDFECKPGDERVTLRELMCHNDSAAVTKALEEQLKAKTGEHDTATWSEKHHDFAHSQGMAHHECAPPAAVRDSQWFGVLQTREKFVLGMRLKEDPSVLNVDVSQTGTRRKVSNEQYAGAVPPTTPGQRVYNMEANRLLLGQEAFRTQGYPINQVAWQGVVSERQVGDLAGNALATGCCGAWLLANLIHLPEQWCSGAAELQDEKFGTRVIDSVAAFLDDSDDVLSD